MRGQVLDSYGAAQEGDIYIYVYIDIYIYLYIYIYRYIYIPQVMLSRWTDRIAQISTLLNCIF